MPTLLWVFGFTLLPNGNSIKHCLELQKSFNLLFEDVFPKLEWQTSSLPAALEGN